MRRAAALALLLIVFADAAGAVPRRPPRITAPPPAPMRGAQVSPDRAPPVPVLPPAPMNATPVDRMANAGDCRRACSRSYYFCASGGDGDGCGDSWAACSSACAAPRYRTPLGL
jgi:hypothetical protein